MQMNSPIPTIFWVRLFQGTVALTAAATFLSLLNEKNNSGWAGIAEPMRVLRAKTVDYDDAIRALEDILAALEAETRQKKATIKLQLRKSSTASLLVKLLTYHNDFAEESVKVCSLVCRIMLKAFAEDPAGRDAWHAANGHKKLLALVSVAHKAGNAKLMDDSAQALQEVSQVDESEMVLPIDIPAGSQGALSLCHFASTVKMLRTLDKNARLNYLVNTTAIFASLCTLRAGGVAIAKGVDGKSGSSFFFELMDSRGNQRLIENCVRALHWIAIHDKGTHDEFSIAANVVKVVDVLEPVQTTNAIHSALGVVACVSHHSKAKAFLTEFMAANGPTALIRLWCKAAEKETRERAETMVRILSRNPLCTDEIARLMDLHRSMLMERRSKDDEAQKKAAMQQQQQRMYQQQMMMQMAQSGQLPPGMMDDEE